MTASQMQFIKAEAAFKSNQKALALTAYKNGIDKSIDYVSTDRATAITAAQKTAFLTSTAVAQVDTDLSLKTS